MWTGMKTFRQSRANDYNSSSFQSVLIPECYSVLLLCQTQGGDRDSWKLTQPLAPTALPPYISLFLQPLTSCNDVMFWREIKKFYQQFDNKLDHYWKDLSSLSHECGVFVAHIALVLEAERMNVWVGSFTALRVKVNVGAVFQSHSSVSEASAVVTDESLGSACGVCFPTGMTDVVNVVSLKVELEGEVLWFVTSWVLEMIMLPRREPQLHVHEIRSYRPNPIAELQRNLSPCSAHTPAPRGPAAIPSVASWMGRKCHSHGWDCGDAYPAAASQDDSASTEEAAQSCSRGFLRAKLMSCCLVTQVGNAFSPSALSHPIHNN